MATLGNRFIETPVFDTTKDSFLFRKQCKSLRNDLVSIHRGSEDVSLVDLAQDIENFALVIQNEEAFEHASGAFPTLRGTKDPDLPIDNKYLGEIVEHTKDKIPQPHRGLLSDRYLVGTIRRILQAWTSVLLDRAKTIDKDAELDIARCFAPMMKRLNIPTDDLDFIIGDSSSTGPQAQHATTSARTPVHNKVHPDAREETAADNSQTGLINGGNTCYQNMVYQLLLASDSLRHRIQAIGAGGFEPQAFGSATQLPNTLASLFKALAESNIPQSLQLLKASWSDLKALESDEAVKPFANRGVQQDAMEFLLEVVWPCLGPGYLNQAWKHTSTSTLSCLDPDCMRPETKEIVDGTVYILHLPTGGIPTNFDELLRFSVSRDEGFDHVCDVCSYDRMRRTESVILSAGEKQELVVNLARFVYDKDHGQKKIEHEVNFSNDPFLLTCEPPGLYFVKAIGVHVGATTAYGHYYTLGRQSPGECTESSLRGFATWSKYNDSQEWPGIEFAEVQKQAGSSAYLCLLAPLEDKDIAALVVRAYNNSEVARTEFSAVALRQMKRSQDFRSIKRLGVHSRNALILNFRALAIDNASGLWPEGRTTKPTGRSDDEHLEGRVDPFWDMDDQPGLDTWTSAWGSNSEHSYQGKTLENWIRLRLADFHQKSVSSPFESEDVMSLALTDFILGREALLEIVRQMITDRCAERTAVLKEERRPTFLGYGMFDPRPDDTDRMDYEHDAVYGPFGLDEAGQAQEQAREQAREQAEKQAQEQERAENQKQERAQEQEKAKNQKQEQAEMQRQELAKQLEERKRRQEQIAQESQARWETISEQLRQPSAMDRADDAPSAASTVSTPRKALQGSARTRPPPPLTPTRPSNLSEHSPVPTFTFEMPIRPSPSPKRLREDEPETSASRRRLNPLVHESSDAVTPAQLSTTADPFVEEKNVPVPQLMVQAPNAPSLPSPLQHNVQSAPSKQVTAEVKVVEGVNVKRREQTSPSEAVARPSSTTPMRTSRRTHRDVFTGVRNLATRISQGSPRSTRIPSAAGVMSPGMPPPAALDWPQAPPTRPRTPRIHDVGRLGAIKFALRRPGEALETEPRLSNRPLDHESGSPFVRQRPEPVASTSKLVDPTPSAGPVSDNDKPGRVSQGSKDASARARSAASSRADGADNHTGFKNGLDTVKAIGYGLLHPGAMKEGVRALKKARSQDTMRSQGSSDSQSSSGAPRPASRLSIRPASGNTLEVIQEAPEGGTHGIERRRSFAQLGAAATKAAFRGAKDAFTEEFNDRSHGERRREDRGRGNGVRQRPVSGSTTGQASRSSKVLSTGKTEVPDSQETDDEL